jgi:hypothetical protein
MIIACILQVVDMVLRRILWSGTALDPSFDRLNLGVEWWPLSEIGTCIHAGQSVYYLPL